MRKLKFILDRRSLETIYISFIRPILEYGDFVFDNCTNEQKKNTLEKVQYETALIVTGATTLVSLRKLRDEIGWDTLESRRQKHKLLLFYKMKNNLTPAYLSDLLPASAQNENYLLRNRADYRSSTKS